MLWILNLFEYTTTIKGYLNVLIQILLLVNIFNMYCVLMHKN